MIRSIPVLPLLLSIAIVVTACGDARAEQPTDPAAGRTPGTHVTSPVIPNAGDASASQAPAASATVAPASPVPETAAPVTPAPTPSVIAPPAEIAREPFAINLHQKGDFVRQYTFEWCVGASLQMMRNLTDATVTTARSTQQRWWELARDRSSSPFGGANPRGWTAALNELGVGPYELVSIKDYDEALRVAARALRETNRPVGLVMWRGRHAWVMSGFESKGDPRTVDDFTVTGIRVLDPLYPHGHSTWGPSPKPNTLITPARLGRQFVSRDQFRVNLGVPPGHLLVLPVEADPAG